MNTFDRFYIDRRDTEIRGLLTPRRIVKVIDNSDASPTVAFRRERRDFTYGPAVCWTAAEFHKRYVIIVAKGERKDAPRSTPESQTP